eukprot:CAMPEP_0201531954 /NCGR_PEP_ID=MMETSP0161_2-20130828/49083_1 /ASSEMBLY_ACC=CAM_ASM_000251 /TAXON_ID=180227 /ORGANISM="Neoparamoeba aestuarina, Strain SoJaBio B1-5/56/2" /LENGTH=474 /DNA_ID=CAMNT_0047935123 /DNA_START=60 /DNA_END=1484 /DNA_ORIENTATION=-
MKFLFPVVVVVCLFLAVSEGRERKNRPPPPKNLLPPTPKTPLDENGTVPFGISAAFAGATPGSAMAITWSTMTRTNISFVMYGRKSNEYTHFIPSEGPTSYYQSFQYHTVLTKDMEPSTQYFYRVGSPHINGGLSEEYSFTTAKAEGDSSTIRIAVFGDMGIDESQDTMARLKALGSDVDFYYHVGDIGYADDHNEIDPLNNKAYEETWNTWQDDMVNVTASYGYMVCPGNHEASCKTSGDAGCPHQLNNFTAYNNRFRMPSPESGGVENMWYSFNYGMVHFISISTETDYHDSPEGPKSLWHAGPFGDQMDWLEQDLVEANLPENRKLRPWIVVIGHRPIYSSVDGDFPPNAIHTLQEAIEDKLYDNNVDMYINGHVHAYERLYPVYKYEVDPNGYNNPRFVTPLVIGNAGCLEGVSSFTTDQPDYVAYRNNRAWGYGILTITDEENLTLQAFEADDNSLLDEFTLNRQYPRN